jgi:hypothetical protein
LEEGIFLSFLCACAIQSPTPSGPFVIDKKKKNIKNKRLDSQINNCAKQNDSARSGIIVVTKAKRKRKNIVANQISFRFVIIS